MARKEIDATAEDMMNDDRPTTAVAVRTETTPAPVGTMDLNMGVNDIPLPRLQIAYGVGKLSEHFNPGDLVLGGDNLLVNKGQPLEVIVITVKQYWKEYLSSEMFAAGINPRKFATEREALEAGGTTQFAGDKKPTFSRALELRMLICKPDDLECGLFGLEMPDGKIYAPALLELDKSAYRAAGPGFLSSARFGLQGNLLAGRFALSTNSSKVGNNMTVVPAIKLLPDRNSEEVQEYIRAAFASKQD